jgi:RNA ligase
LTTTLATTIADIFDSQLFAEMVDDGYVRIQTHPTLPLKIANYAEKAVYERVWNPVTRQCRGLIFDADSGEVLARPLPKFWNTHEAEAGALDLNEPAVVMDKADGSLAVIWTAPDGPAVATRGSFTSEQATHATNLLRTRYADWTPRTRSCGRRRPPTRRFSSTPTGSVRLA